MGILGTQRNHMLRLRNEAGPVYFLNTTSSNGGPIWKMLSATAAASLWRWIELRVESVRRGWSRERGRSGLYGFLARSQAYPRHAATFSASWRYASACGLGRDQTKGRGVGGRGVGREGYQKAGEGSHREAEGTICRIGSPDQARSLCDSPEPHRRATWRMQNPTSVQCTRHQHATA